MVDLNLYGRSSEFHQEYESSLHLFIYFFAQRSINIRDYVRLNNIYCNDHVELFYSYKFVRVNIRTIPSNHLGFDR
jgi:hypothetical protein